MHFPASEIELYLTSFNPGNRLEQLACRFRSIQSSLFRAAEGNNLAVSLLRTTFLGGTTTIDQPQHILIHQKPWNVQFKIPAPN
jgi:hypothetical protein